MNQEELLAYLKESASIGVSKTSLAAFLKELKYTDSEIRRLLNKLNLKSRPRGINYNYFYHCPIHPDAIQLVKEKYNTQIYALDNFLTEDECSQLMDMIDLIHRPSTVADAKDSSVINKHRTSQTADLQSTKHPLVLKINYQLAKLLDLDSTLGEALQGQKYLPGQYYKAHTDFFRYHSKEYKTYTEWMGQRTWTTMIYLNDVEEGGETYFKYLYLKVKPKRGTVVFWNNLFQNGRPNQKTLHEALPPTKETKYVITKWWRSWPVI